MNRNIVNLMIIIGTLNINTIFSPNLSNNTNASYVLQNWKESFEYSAPLKNKSEIITSNLIEDISKFIWQLLPDKNYFTNKEKPISTQNKSSITFPKDSGVINVTLAPYGAIPNDNKDDTKAIQKALNAGANSNHIVYLPEGTYIVSDRLDWPKGERSGSEHKRTILQGENRDRTIIKLQDNASDYQDPNNPKAVIWTGTKPAQRFRNAIRDLTVSTGNNNPGAIGIQFIANNQGGIRNVAIISEDGQGQVGLDMKYTDEIGPLYVEGLYVKGFDYGIQTYWQTASITFENITLENQNILGWENSGQAIFIRSLKSTNAVTALKNVENTPGAVALIDANLTGTGDESVPAILNQKSMFLRNIKTSGYSMAVEHEDKGRGNEPGVASSNIEEWVSHGKEQLISRFDSSNVSLNLSIEDTPIVPQDDLDDWRNNSIFT